MHDPHSSNNDGVHPRELANRMKDDDSPDATEPGRQRLQSSPDRGPLFVLINVSSGSGGDQRANAIRQHLRDAGLEAHLFPIDRPERVDELLARATDLAREAGGTMVIAGGDGTINASLPLLLKDDIPLGILPSGTFNYVAREFDIPLNLEDAVHNLVTGVLKEVPVAQVNDRPFLVNASLGLYPRLLQDREQAKRKYGRNRALALLWSASSLIARRDRTFRLEVQRRSGEEQPLGAPHALDISTLFIGNNTLQLRNLGIEPEPSELMAIVLRKPTPFRLVGLGLRAAFGTLGEAKDILTFPFEKLVAKEQNERGGVKIALDGEVMKMRGPLVFNRTPRPLRLIIPRPSRFPEPS